MGRWSRRLARRDRGRRKPIRRVGRRSSRNTGLLLARADIVSFLDDDAAAAARLARATARRVRHTPGSRRRRRCATAELRRAAAILVPARFRVGVRLPLPMAAGPTGSHTPLDRHEHERASRATCSRSAGSTSTNSTTWTSRTGSPTRTARPPSSTSPAREVHHYVPPERMTWSYFSRRCFSVNRNKVGALVDMGEGGNIGAELRFGVGVLLALFPALLAAVTGRPERLRASAGARSRRGAGRMWVCRRQGAARAGSPAGDSDDRAQRG